MDLIKLSIIIPTWNTAAITLKAVQTINRHLKGPEYEIIVVDNGSTDNTSNLLSGQPHTILLTNKTNLGFSKANNIGASRAAGEYLLFLNSDMELIDDSISLMLDYLKNHPQTGLIGPKFLNPDLTSQASAFPPQTITNAFKEFWLGQPAYSKYLPDTSSPSSVWAISGGAVLVRSKLFKQIGGWNEKYFMYFEDLDLCRQVRRRGLKIIFFPDCQLIHRHGASGSKLADPQNQWRRLIKGSIQYHGRFYHTLLNFVIWSGQKFRKLINYKHA